MNRILILKRTVDLVMLAGLAVVFAYQWTGNKRHEVLGTAWIVLVLFHNLLNRGWYKTLLRGNYSPRRILGLIINVLLCVDVAVLAVSGVFLSRDVFAFAGLSGGLTWHAWHVAAAYWFVTLGGLHAGMHLPPLVNRLQQHIGKGLIYGAAGAVTCAGVWGLAAFKWWPRLWGLSPFIGWDGSLIKFVVLILAVFGLFAIAGYLITGEHK